ncbi:MAG: DNA/RNA non-specific endonuclease [Treponema sp.]|nr:DNA/RNA non-specific endonuclease [Treponema sp.]
MKSLFYSFGDFKKYISIFLCSAALLFASCTHGIGGEQKQTLTVATQAHAIAYAENTALYLGNPSFARTEVAYAENYLIERTQYSLSYNNATRIPNWVAWHLCSSDIGNVKRKNKFRRDPLVPRLWYRVDKNDYQHGTYGFDRGHMCPSGDRTDTAENNSATFFMTNMVPQSPANNQTVWNYFEKHIRDVVKNNSMEAYVVCGPYGAGGGSKKMTNVVEIVTDSGNAITVPSHTWKAVIYLQEGTDDISRIDEFTMVEAVFVPNDESCRGKPWESYRCSIDFIEEKTGYDLFARIPDEIEAVIEAKMN